MQVELEDTIADILKRLQSQAAARHLPFDVYLRQFVEPDANGYVEETLTLDEFDQALDELAARPPGVTSLPAEFSRADIYADHD